ncbi:MAG TPA: protease modulator HflC [Desulfobacterales bacterium]|nr:protease modulator HflC [Desulfobacterales bacterium]
MNKIIRMVVIVVVLGLIATAWDGFFVLPEGRQAVVTQFGAPVGQPIVKAGLHFKTPFIQDVQYFDKRLLIWDGDPNQIPTKDKTFVYVDVSARWRISNALTFLQAVNNESRAQGVLDDIIGSTVRDLINKHNLVEIIRSSDWNPEDHLGPDGKPGPKVIMGRDGMEKRIREIVSKATPKYGIEVVDVMFKRVNYIESVRKKVYERMISERKRIAAEKRSLGEGQKAEILGRVGRELKTITSAANETAEEIKGKADAKAVTIYAAAYNRDPEFYAFSKTLQSYEKTMGKNTNLVISSDSPFFKYMQDMKGTK